MTIEIFVAILSGLIISVLGIFYITSRIRHQDMQLLRQTNDDLRKSINDKGIEIRDMKVQLQELVDKSASQNERIVALEASNKTLEDLVKIALEEYFRSHPEVATNVKGSVHG